MGRRQARVPVQDADERLLLVLSERQFINPHRPLSETLAGLSSQFGFCEPVAERAIAWLELDGTTSIGRLRRSELSQLARSINRFWRQALQRGSPASAGVNLSDSSQSINVEASAGSGIAT